MKGTPLIFLLLLLSGHTTAYKHAHLQKNRHRKHQSLSPLSHSVYA